MEICGNGPRVAGTGGERDIEIFSAAQIVGGHFGYSRKGRERIKIHGFYP